MTIFHDASYQKHASAFDGYVTSPERQQVADSWLDTSTANYWRHARSYDIANILGNEPGEAWLTVGDGRFGLDAQRLKEQGAAAVLPTDLSETLLMAAKKSGAISEYSVENAERLSFAGSSFDYVFCKESYHHFPRPMIALYEMLRVAKKGVILIEPNDKQHAPARIAKNALKRLVGRKTDFQAENYEEDGNYVFSISKREIEKVALGLNLPQIAFKGLNDYYETGIEFQKIESPMGRKMRRHIALCDALCKTGLNMPSMLMACIFHLPLVTSKREAMIKAGWEIKDLPRNPYHLR